MRIGLIAPPWVPVPPPAYGGTELVIDNLARGLKELGHDVRLFTVGESTCPVPTEYLYREPRAPIGLSIVESAHVVAAYEALADVDLIHDHTLLGPLVAGSAGVRRPPVVTTNHGPFTDETRPIWSAITEHASLICISHSQARASGSVPVSAVIHHGIDLDVHQSGPGGGDYLMFIGRMSADKGVHHAVKIAKEAGLPLVMATKMREAAEIDYFNAEVRPLLASEDQMPMEMPLRRRLSLLRGATGLSTRSPGASRSGWSWPRRSRPARRCWPSPTGPPRRSSIRAGPGSCAGTRRRWSRPSARCRRSTGTSAAAPPSGGSRCSGWLATMSGSTGACSSARCSRCCPPRVSRSSPPSRTGRGPAARELAAGPHARR